MTVPSVASSQPPGTATQVLRLEHGGRVVELLPIVLVNAILNIVTLTLYRFWAKTRVRHYLWSGTKMMGDRFEYTGRGIELFLGFLVVLAVVIVPLGASSARGDFLWARDDPVRYGGVARSDRQSRRSRWWIECTSGASIRLPQIIHSHETRRRIRNQPKQASAIVCWNSCGQGFQSVGRRH